MALRQVKDTPTNNFATWNSLENAQRNAVLSDGNLKTTDSTSNWSVRFLNLVPTKGMYYVEFYIQESATTTGVGIIVGNGMRTWVENYVNSGYPYDSNTFGHFQNGSIYHNNSTETYGFSFSDGNVVSMIIDYTTRNFWVRVNNNVVSGDNHVTGLQSGGVALAHGYSELPEGDMYVYCCQRGVHNNSAQSRMYLNAGQDHTFLGNKSGGGNYQDSNGIGSFYFQPPAGALALCSRNIQSVEQDESYVQNYTSAKGNFRAVTWKNTGADVSVPLGFEADLIWYKSIDADYSHNIQDSCRGWDSGYLNTNNTNSSAVTDSGYTAKNVNNGGFTFSSSYSTSENLRMVAWCWKAGGAPAANEARIIEEDGTLKTKTDGSQYTTAQLVTDTGASVTPSKLSANRQNGFSILQFSRSRSVGQTVPHGLTSAPEFMILKEATNSSGPWIVYHKNLSSAANYLHLQSTGSESALGTTNAYFNSTHPGSSVVTLADASTLDSDVICYIWHSVPGYSSFGSFAGNGSADGPFVYTGFKPAFVMTKLYTGTSTADYHSWSIYDSSRITNNPVHSPLYANRTHAEGKRGNTGGSSGGDILYVDFLSNGFKCRANGTELNGTENDKFIYMAFAEQPGAFSNAR